MTCRFAVSRLPLGDSLGTSRRRNRTHLPSPAPLLTYEAALAAFLGPTSATLVDDAIAIAVELTTYRAVDDEAGDAGLTQILKLDAIVSAVVAAERCGRLPTAPPTR